jgi:hypothetical protein
VRGGGSGRASNRPAAGLPVLSRIATINIFLFSTGDSATLSVIYGVRRVTIATPVESKEEMLETVPWD